MKISTQFFLIFSLVGLGSANAKPSADKQTSEIAVAKPSSVEDLANLLQQAAAVPHKNAKGKIDGYKILDIEPNSIYAKLGIKNGDILLDINGQSLESPAVGIELLNQLNSGEHVKLTYLRNGKKQISNYKIKDKN